jgi:hypothetical protein
MRTWIFLSCNCSTSTRLQVFTRKAQMMVEGGPARGAELVRLRPARQEDLKRQGGRRCKTSRQSRLRRDPTGKGGGCGGATHLLREVEAELSGQNITTRADRGVPGPDYHRQLHRNIKETITRGTARCTRALSILCLWDSKAQNIDDGRDHGPYP